MRVNDIYCHVLMEKLSATIMLYVFLRFKKHESPLLCDEAYFQAMSFIIGIIFKWLSCNRLFPVYNGNKMQTMDVINLTGSIFQICSFWRTIIVLGVLCIVV
jgi:hypothetical protein